MIKGVPNGGEEMSSNR